MNRRVISGLFAVALSVTGVCAEDAAPPAEQPQPAPRIACDEPSFDFGAVDSSQTVEHEFLLKNVGDLTLEIGNIRPSCGCTVATPPTVKSVPPGGESRFTARLSLQGRSGRQHKTIVIESNDPQQPQLMLTMQGDVATPITVEPERVIFGQLAPDAQVTNAVLITTGSQDFRINSVDAGGSPFDATVETVQEGRQYRVLVSTKTPLPSGGVGGSVRVMTDHPGRPFIEIPVAAAVLSEIMVAPEELLIQAPAGQNVSQFLVVRPGLGKAFTLENVEPPDPAIQVQIQPFGQDGYRIFLQNIPVSPDLNGKVVRITTSSESMHEIIVPFRVNITQG